MKGPQPWGGENSLGPGRAVVALCAHDTQSLAWPAAAECIRPRKTRGLITLALTRTEWRQSDRGRLPGATALPARGHRGPLRRTGRPRGACTHSPSTAGGPNGRSATLPRGPRWLPVMMGMPEGTDGLLVSGGSMANLLGLAAARNQMAPSDVRLAPPM